MEEHIVPNEIQPDEPIKLEDTVYELKKNLDDLFVKYNTDMRTLNKILSTYEDEISSLRGQFFDMSYKYKQLQHKLGDGVET